MGTFQSEGAAKRARGLGVCRHRLLVRISPSRSSLWGFCEDPRRAELAIAVQVPEDVSGFGDATLMIELRVFCNAG